MSLQVLGMKVGLRAVRARILAVSILYGPDCAVLFGPAVAAGTAGRPGALGKIPRRP